MLTAFISVETQGGLWLIALATTICGAGSWTSTRLLDQMLRTRDTPRRTGIFLTSLVLGTTAWTTGQLATLVYLPKAYERVDTLNGVVALAVGIGGTCLALTIATMRERWLDVAIGGSVLGLTTITIPMATLLGPVGAKAETLNFGPTALVIGPGVVASAVALTAVWGGFGDAAKRFAPWLLGFAILAMHLVMVKAIGINSAVFPSSAIIDRSPASAMALLIISVLIIASGYSAFLIDARGRREINQRVAALTSTDVQTVWRTEWRSKTSCGSAPRRMRHQRPSVSSWSRLPISTQSTSNSVCGLAIS